MAPLGIQERRERRELRVLQQPLQLQPLHPLHLGEAPLRTTRWDRQANKHANSLLELTYWRRFLAHPHRILVSTHWPLQLLI